jgi:predicted dehydrogenase
MLGIGIVGANYGRNVLLPAFRKDARCEVVGLAASTPERAIELARASGLPRSFAHWEELIEDDAVAAVAVAVPPDLQPAIAQRALACGKAVFVEKPLAADLAGARAMLACANRSGRPHMIDFNFPELPTWQAAKTMIAGGALGRLRHAVVTWNLENESTRAGLKTWKTTAQRGGGILGNFVSHCFHYLEWFCGPICGLAGRVFTLSDGEREGSVALTFAFACGAGGSLQMSCASFLGSGHRIELYGDDGTLVLSNPTPDYFRGFTLMHGRRGDSSLQVAPVAEDTVPASIDSRIAPVARLVSRFIDACAHGGAAVPGFGEGYRVQCLIDAGWRSHRSGGSWIDVSVREDIP